MFLIGYVETHGKMESQQQQPEIKNLVNISMKSNKTSRFMEMASNITR